MLTRAKPPPHFVKAARQDKRTAKQAKRQERREAKRRPKP
jgi:hypothetical protein